MSGDALTVADFLACQCGQLATEVVVTFGGDWLLERCHACAVRDCDPLAPVRSVSVSAGRLSERTQR